MEIGCDDNVGGFEIAVDDVIGVKVGEDFDDLSQIKQHDLLFLAYQVDIMVDPGNQFEQVSVGAVVQNLREVVVSFDCLMKLDDAWVTEFP